MEKAAFILLLVGLHEMRCHRSGSLGFIIF